MFVIFIIILWIFLYYTSVYKKLAYVKIIEFVDLVCRLLLLIRQGKHLKNNIFNL